MKAYLQIAISFSMLCLVVAGCSEDPAEMRTTVYPPMAEPLPPQGVLVTIWMQEHDDLPQDAMLEGCNLWNDVGIRCEYTTRDLADIKIYADEKPWCESNENTGGTTIGRAWINAREINMMTFCLGRPYGNEVSRLMFRSLAAHEIGHVLGMGHIANPCYIQPEVDVDMMEDAGFADSGMMDMDPVDAGPPVLNPDAQIHPNGRPICGISIMNPFVNPQLDHITEPDYRNFDVRSGNGVADNPTGADSHTGDVIDCALEPN